MRNAPPPAGRIRTGARPGASHNLPLDQILLIRLGLTKLQPGRATRSGRAARAEGRACLVTKVKRHGGSKEASKTAFREASRTRKPLEFLGTDAELTTTPNASKVEQIIKFVVLPFRIFVDLRTRLSEYLWFKVL